MRVFDFSFLIIVLSLTLAFQTPCIAQDAPPQYDVDNQSPDRSLTGFEDPNELQPLWELGAGGGMSEFANYPGSSERNFVALVAPYVVYRGDVFRLGGGGGARAVVVEDSNFEIDLSLGGAFSADSEDNSVREGMPELDYLFEIGPQFVYKIKTFDFNNGGKARLNGRLQTRVVFSTDFSGLDQRGYVIEPELTYQQRGVLFADTGLNVSLSMTFATEDLHDYFYQVDEAFVTESRGAFDAKGGYLGSRLGVSVAFPIGDSIRGFIGGAVNFHVGAANDDSPLFEDKLTYSLGAGFVWRFYESQRKASW